MLKISFVGLFFLALFGFDDGVIVVDTTPAHMTPGESVVVDITITKSQIQSFGKLLINLPEGFTAEEVDSQGSTFTFSGNKAKFIWMTLPQSEVFTVKYMLVAGDNIANNDYNMAGVFSYIKNNQRVDYRLTDKIIKVNKVGEVPEEMYTDDPLNNDNNTPEDNNNNATAGATNGSGTEMETPSVSQITCFRSYERIAPDQFKITLKVIRSGYVGFAKIADGFSVSYDVAEGDSDGAVTVASEGKIKYVWFEVPEVDEFYVTYFLTSDEFANASPEIKGKLSVVENGEPKDTPIIDNPFPGGVEYADNGGPDKSNNGSDIPTGSNTVVPSGSDNTNPIGGNNPTGSQTEPTGNNTPSGSTTTTPTGGNTTQPDPANTNPSGNNNNNSNPTETSQEDVPVATTTEEIPDITTVPNPETGVSYKVQILAAHKTIGRTYFKRQHRYAESFNIENHEGWIKYTTGSHSDYKNARDERVRINNNYVLPGPFVTAYNEGVRITVQEALMITKQQWYQ